MGIKNLVFKDNSADFGPSLRYIGLKNKVHIIDFYYIKFLYNYNNFFN